MITIHNQTCQLNQFELSFTSQFNFLKYIQCQLLKFIDIYFRYSFNV